MSGVKIQISSLEALERLIGGDTQLEIDLRSSIVQEFSKKYLKSVAAEFSNTLKEPLDEALQNALDDAWRNRLPQDLYDKLHAEVQSLIAKTCAEELSSQIAQTMAKFRTAIDAISVEDSLDVKVQRLVDKRLNERLSKMVYA